MGKQHMRWTRHGRTELIGWGATIFGITLATLYFYPLLAIVPAALLVLLFNFFRDPDRPVPTEPGLIVAPADGKVTDVQQMTENEYIGGPAVRVGIFLSIFNVHVNRIPCAGVVEHLQHREGRYLDARNPNSATENERQDVGLIAEGPDGQPMKVLVRQISGLVARRIICTLTVGASLARGERYGMIKFGSRTEVYLPAEAGFEAAVTPGDRVKGGETVLGRLRGAAAEHERAHESTDVESTPDSWAAPSTTGSASSSGSGQQSPLERNDVDSRAATLGGDVASPETGPDALAGEPGEVETSESRWQPEAEVPSEEADDRSTTEPPAEEALEEPAEEPTSSGHLSETETDAGTVIQRVPEETSESADRVASPADADPEDEARFSPSEPDARPSGGPALEAAVPAAAEDEPLPERTEAAAESEPEMDEDQEPSEDEAGRERPDEERGAEDEETSSEAGPSSSSTASPGGDSKRHRKNRRKKRRGGKPKQAQEPSAAESSSASAPDDTGDAKEDEEASAEDEPSPNPFPSSSGNAGS